jgi:hypothetical protein
VTGTVEAGMSNELKIVNARDAMRGDMGQTIDALKKIEKQCIKDLHQAIEWDSRVTEDYWWSVVRWTGMAEAGIDKISNALNTIQSEMGRTIDVLSERDPREKEGTIDDW